jgi:hypothetical protein
MDSQLLTLTSIVTLDFFTIEKRKITKERIVVVVLGIVGFLIAVKPPQTILDFIGATTFNGLSVLLPTVLGGLYWKRANAPGAIASIAVGEALVVASYLGFVQIPGTLPVVPILSITAAVYAGVCLLVRRSSGSRSSGNPSLVFPVDKKSLWAVPLFLGVFVLGHDFWNWGREPRFFWGLPLWVWYYFGLGILTSGAFAFYFRVRKRALKRGGSPPGAED